MRLKGLYWELRKAVSGQSIWQRRSPCPLYPRSEDFCGKIWANWGRISACLVDHWKFWDRSPIPQTPKPERCLLDAGSAEKAWNTALKDFGRLLPSSCNLRLSEQPVSESIGNPRLISLMNHTCHLQRPGQENWHLGESLKEQPQIETPWLVSVCGRVVQFPAKMHNGDKNSMSKLHMDLFF